MHCIYFCKYYIILYYFSIIYYCIYHCFGIYFCGGSGRGGSSRTKIAEVSPGNCHLTTSDGCGPARMPLSNATEINGQLRGLEWSRSYANMETYVGCLHMFAPSLSQAHTRRISSSAQDVSRWRLHLARPPKSF